MRKQVQWVLLGGVSVPAIVSEEKDGTYTATSPDWHVTAGGFTPTHAMRELGQELARRVERAIEASRKEALAV